MFVYLSDGRMWLSQDYINQRLANSSACEACMCSMVLHTWAVINTNGMITDCCFSRPELPNTPDAFPAFNEYIRIHKGKIVERIDREKLEKLLETNGEGTNFEFTRMEWDGGEAIYARYREVIGTPVQDYQDWMEPFRWSYVPSY